MKSWRALLNSLHKLAGKSSLAVKVALLARNQAECVIGYHLGEDAEVTDENNSEEWLIQQVAPSSRAFVDVGANRGDWARLFLKHAAADARGWLFEPNAALAAQLRTTFAGRSVQIISQAVSDRVGEFTLHVAAGDGKTSSFAKAAVLDASTTQTVRATTLDEASSQFGFEAIDFLKLDAEGYDLHVLRGASRLLELNRIKILQFEYGSAWPFAGNTLAAAIDFLLDRRYKIYLLRRNGLLRFSYPKFREFFRYSTFVGISEDQLTGFERLVIGDA